MVEYFPWSEGVRDHCLNESKAGKIPILDLDFSSKCCLKTCIYCDSITNLHEPDALTFSELSEIIDKAYQKGLKYINICGIGEPTDDDKFLDLLELASKYDICVSVFTNGLFSTEILKHILNHNVCLIMKMDSFNPSIFELILGKQGLANRIYNLIDELVSNGFVNKKNSNQTNLAFSIVPTRLNFNEIEDIVSFCKQNKIFPSIGELEFAGKAVSLYKDISLSKEELTVLKGKVEKILGYEYQRPICPSIISGLHISNTGKCIVDRLTGLNCHWFMLKNPDMIEIGDTRLESLDEINAKVRKYRKENFQPDFLEKDCMVPNVFGGCGGSLVEVAKKAVEYIY